MFKDLEKYEFQKDALLLCSVADVHILAMGEPGTGKSEISKRVIQICPRGRYVDVPNATGSGIIGTVNKDQFTGRWEIDNGEFIGLHPGGRIALDELPLTDESVHHTLLGIMNDQILRVHKANNRINRACEVYVIATANPIEETINEYENINENIAIPKRLFDRFDIVIIFRNHLDISSIDNLQKLVLNGIIDKPSPEKLLVLKKYVSKAKQINVIIDNDTAKKIATISQEFLVKVSEKYKPSYRKIQTMKKLLIGFCRFHLIDKPIKSTFQAFTDFLLKHSQNIETYGEEGVNNG